MASTAPATGTPTPATGTPIPATGTPAPATGTPAPATGTSAPATGTPTPATGTPAPATGTPAPATGTSAPATGTPVPATGTPAPATGTSAPATGTPVPATGTPAPATGTSAPATGTPVPATGTPASGTSAPATGTPAPATPSPMSAPPPGTKSARLAIPPAQPVPPISSPDPSVPPAILPPPAQVESEDEETTDIHGVPDSVLVNENIRQARMIELSKMAATVTLPGVKVPHAAVSPPSATCTEGVPPPVTEAVKTIPALQRFLGPIKWVLYNKIKVGVYALVAISLVLLATPPSYTPTNSITETIDIIYEAYCDRSELGALIQKSIDEYTATSIGYGGLQKPLKLPAIDKRLLLGLSNYVCENFPLNKVFSLWGPVGCGKTLTVNHMAKVWQKQGRVVIYIDMSDFSGQRGTGELKKLINDAIQEGFKNIDLSARSLRALDELLEDKTSKSKVASGMASSAINVLLKLALQGFTWLPLEGLEQKLSNLYDKRLQSLGRFMESFIQNDDEALVGIRFGNFFDALHVLSLTQPKTAPIVIFSNLNSIELASIEEGNAFLDDLADQLEEHESTKNAVPVIITSDDTLWQHQADIAHSNLFVQFEVREMAEQEVMDVLVAKLKVWTPAEFNVVWKAMGGWFGQLDKTYRLQTMFQLKIEDAVKRVEREVYGALQGAITSWNDTDDATTPQSLLQTLQDNEYALPLTSLDEMSSAEETLLKRDILYVDSEMMMRPVHKLMETCIREYLGTPQQDGGSQE